jgi:hypothetical protein
MPARPPRLSRAKAAPHRNCPGEDAQVDYGTGRKCADGLSKKLAVPFLKPLALNLSFSVMFNCKLPGCLSAGVHYYTSPLSFYIDIAENVGGQSIRIYTFHLASPRLLPSRESASAKTSVLGPIPLTYTAFGCNSALFLVFLFATLLATGSIETTSPIFSPRAHNLSPTRTSVSCFTKS